MDQLLEALGEEIQDAEEETFLLFTQTSNSQNLGFIDPKAQSVNVTVRGSDYIIHQSPTILSSNRPGGTTGAVLWKITPLFASWLATETNVLFRNGILNHSSAVLELGCGISPLNALALSSSVARYVLTDQSYVQKLVRRNIEDNVTTQGLKVDSKVSRGRKSVTRNPLLSQADITFETLDWEQDMVVSLCDDVKTFDIVLACDCIYNYALVDPLVQTCAAACKLRMDARNPCVCIIAQQLRSDDVFQAWLNAMLTQFRVWRVPDEELPDELLSTAGFVVHIALLR